MRIPRVMERSGVDHEPTQALALTFARDDDGRENPLRPYARIEAYVCRSCGLTELYTRDFDTLPIGERFGTEPFEVPAKPPYR